MTSQGSPLRGAAPLVLYVLSALAAPPSFAAAQTAVTPPGFQARVVPLVKPAKSWTGPAVLPDGGLAFFDGLSLVRIDPNTGRTTAVLAKLGAAVWGTDLVLGPSGRRLYFGESSTGALYVYDLAAKTLRRFGRLQLHYDFAFHPIEGERFLYATAKPNSGSLTQVYRIDTFTGAPDLILEETGWSGPLAFDRAGNLLTAPAPLKFGAKGQGRILRWPAAKVLSAIGPGKLGESAAQVLVKGFDNARDFDLDGEGTLYAADGTSGSSSLLEIGPAGGTFATGVLKLAGFSLGHVRFARGPHPFERFGAAGSKIYLTATNWTAGTSVLVVLEPARPRLTATPGAAPRRGTPLTVRAGGLKGLAFGLWLLGFDRVPERPFAPAGAGGLLFPDLGIVPTLPFVTLPLRIDAAGTASVTITTPGPSGLRFTVQALAGLVRALPGGTPPSPWVTSGPLRVRVQ